MEVRQQIPELFNEIARKASAWFGSAMAFVLAVLSILVWLASGPHFGFSDQWSLAVNTGTTIVTFLMVFLVQNTQSRDMAALQLKMDEVIRVTAARNDLIGLENARQADYARLKDTFPSQG